MITFEGKDPLVITVKRNKIFLLILLYLLTAGRNILSASIRVLAISPSTTDSRIKTFVSDSHQVYFDPQVPARNQLLVYLPASFDATRSASTYCLLAAQAGYQVITLTYPGTDKMYSTCEHSTDELCYENFHREIVEGKNYSNFIAVDSTESIFYRLKAVLIYLDKKFPDEKWSSYLSGTQSLNNTRIVWSGHSDAAGHVAVISKYYEVQRALCFSGPKDFSLHYYLPPVWLHTGIWKTDKKNVFVFGHLSDDYLFQKEIWDSLGLNAYGAPVNVDQVPYPYRNAHQLITSQGVSIGDRHGCTIQDIRTPVKSSVPVFETVWKYMLDISLQSTIVQQKELSPIKVFPNPLKSSEKITVEAPEIITRTELINLSGKSIAVLPASPGFQIPPVAPGIYVLKINCRNTNYFRKIEIY